MNFPYFIAKKVSFSGKKNFSRLIIRIAIVAIALSMTVMIAATSLIQGFKQEITTKIFGFWGHIHINDNNYIRSSETKPIDVNQDFYPSLADVESVTYSGTRGVYNFQGDDKVTKGGIAHIQRFGLKEGILETDDAIEGIFLKGIWTDYNWDFLQQYLVKGEVINFPEDKMSRDILISKTTANRLKLDVGDKLVVNFVINNQELKRRMNICGIYKTGLEEYDKRFALVDLRQVQRLLGWSENEVSGFEVFVDNIDDLDVYRYYLTEEVLPLKLYAESIRYKFPGIFEWLELQNINEVVIIILMIIDDRSAQIGRRERLGNTENIPVLCCLYHWSGIAVGKYYWHRIVFAPAAIWFYHFERGGLLYEYCSDSLKYDDSFVFEYWDYGDYPYLFNYSVLSGLDCTARKSA